MRTRGAQVADGSSGRFHALNLGKRGVVAQPGDPLFTRLVATADIVIHDLSPTESARFGLDAASTEAGEARIADYAVWCERPTPATLPKN